MEAEDRSSITNHLRGIHSEFNSYGDGGYAEVTAVRCWIQRFEDADRDTILGVLTNLASEEEPELWGLAIEVLVQEECSIAMEALTISKARSDHSPDWVAYVELAAKRLVKNCKS